MKNLILLRGLPGSGKTSLAAILSEKGNYPVFSIDSYFTDPESGLYSFDPLKNHLAYKACEENTEKAMKAGLSKIFVDNTFTIEWELEAYFRLAGKYNYRIYVLTVENRHGGVNTHGVSTGQMQKMAEKYQVKLM